MRYHAAFTSLHNKPEEIADTRQRLSKHIPAVSNQVLYRLYDYLLLSRLVIVCSGLCPVVTSTISIF
jgi:hypothetical protein